MNRKVVALAVAIGLSSAVAPTRANASCSNTTLQVCASVSAYYNGSGNLVLRAWNLFGSQGVSHVMTFVGIGNSSWSGTASFVGASFNGSAINTWKMAKSINQNAVGAELDLAGLTTGINNGLVGCGGTIPPGGYITSCGGPGGPYLELEFSLTSAMDLSNAITGWHSQAVNNTSCSLWVDSNGKVAGSTNPGDVGDCSSVVPEPISMILLGSGLAGVGGIGALRRRKKDDELA